MGLSKQRRVFVEEFLRCWTAAEAARRAGYAHPRQRGSELMRVPEIAEEIQRRVSELAMSANEVLVRLAEHARGSAEDFITIDRRGRVKIDLQKARDAGKLHLVRKIKKGEFGVEIELHDAQAALVQLGRALGLFLDRQAMDVDGTVRIEYVNDWRETDTAADAAPGTEGGAAESGAVPLDCGGPEMAEVDDGAASGG